MANPVLSADYFHNEDAAFAYVEAHLWPSGPVCPHCQNEDDARIGRLSGKSSRPGLRKCYACRKTFTVRIGSIFEDSHFPLRLWLQAIQLITASKKGISTRQIQRTFNCSMKTAWFLMHRVREMMAPGADTGPLGGSGKIVEADETELSRSRKTKRPEGFRRKTHNPVVVSLVERGGNIRSEALDHRGVMSYVRRGVHPASTLVTDQAQHYKFPPVANHQAVDHSKFEWVRDTGTVLFPTGEPLVVHTNTLEGFFSVLKRGMVGVYQRVEKQHLNRYLAEFDFRQNTRAKLGYSDVQRASVLVQGAKGKRLTYQTTHSEA